MPARTSCMFAIAGWGCVGLRLGMGCVARAGFCGHVFLPLCRVRAGGECRVGHPARARIDPFDPVPPSVTRAIDFFAFHPAKPPLLPSLLASSHPQPAGIYHRFTPVDDQYVPAFLVSFP